MRLVLILLCMVFATANFGCQSGRGPVSSISSEVKEEHEEHWLSVIGSDSGWMVDGEKLDDDQLRARLKNWSVYENSELGILGQRACLERQNTVIYEMAAHEPAACFFTFVKLAIEARIENICGYLKLDDGSLLRCRFVSIESNHYSVDENLPAIGFRVDRTPNYTKFEHGYRGKDWESVAGSSVRDTTELDAKSYSELRGVLMKSFQKHRRDTEIVISRHAGEEFPTWQFLFVAIDAARCGLSESKSYSYREPVGFLIIDYSGLGYDTPFGTKRSWYLISVPPEPDMELEDDVEWEDEKEDETPRPDIYKPEADSPIYED